MRIAIRRIARELPPSANGALVLAALFVGISALSAVSPPRLAQPEAAAAASARVTAAAVTPAVTPEPIATATPILIPSPTPGTATPPVSAGSVPDAGVVYVIGGDDAIHRYDGRTGTLARIWAKSTFGAEIPEAVYVLGRQGGAQLLRWDGTVTAVECGTGVLVSVAPTGACAGQGDGIEVVLPSATPRQLLPADWLGAAPTWSSDGRSLLVIRTLEGRPGPGTDPGLSTLWLMRPDGTTSELYRPPGRGVLSRPTWSPDGTKALVLQIETTSNSFAADGVGVTTLLVDVRGGTTRSLGTVMHNWSTWSSDGTLAFIRGGGRRTWWDKELVLLGADGSERVVGEPGRVAIGSGLGPGRAAWMGQWTGHRGLQRRRLHRRTWRRPASRRRSDRRCPATRRVRRRTCRRRAALVRRWPEAPAPLPPARTRPATAGALAVSPRGRNERTARDRPSERQARSRVRVLRRAARHHEHRGVVDRLPAAPI